MYNHAASNYICPICLGLEGIESEDTMLKKEDLIYRDELTSVFINSFFVKGNEGHVIVVPNKHIENVYDIDPKYAHAVTDSAQKMSIAIKKAYECDGITLRQNNEPAGGQHAFHFHLHVLPRYQGDTYNTEGGNKITTTLEERRPYIAKIKEAIGQ
jgi:histidine triad (HIT) family protein